MPPSGFMGIESRTVREAMDQGYGFLRVTCPCGRIVDYPFGLLLQRRGVNRDTFLGTSDSSARTVAQNNLPSASIREPAHRDITDPDKDGFLNPDPVKELLDLIQADRLPKFLTGPRQFDENGSDRVADFTKIKVTCRETASEAWQFLQNWFDSWLRVVITGCVTGGVVGFVWRLMLLPN